MTIEGQLRERVSRLEQGVPAVFRWFRGDTQPPVRAKELVFWEDTDDGNAKILMRRDVQTFVFESYADGAGGFVADSRLLTAGAGLTGGGDLSANRTFDVGAGNGITVNANDVAVDLTFGFNWTGDHNFTNLIEADGGVGTSSGALTLNPNGASPIEIKTGTEIATTTNSVNSLAFRSYTRAVIGTDQPNFQFTFDRTTSPTTAEYMLWTVDVGALVDIFSVDGVSAKTSVYDGSGLSLVTWAIDDYTLDSGASNLAIESDHILYHDATDDSQKKVLVDDFFTTAPAAFPLVFSIYDAEPARGSESNIHGGLLSLATGQPLDSVPTDLVVTKGIGKLLIVVNAGSDLAGDITVTGTSVDRDTGATTGADTDTLTIDAVTTDNSDTDSNGNTRHAFAGAYVTSKWFTGTVTLSTTNLTLTDVDVYHVSFEQFNDAPVLTLNTFDANIFTTNVAAEFDCYLYVLEASATKFNVVRVASLNVGADGETAIANKYWRLRRGGLDREMEGTTDGIWIDVHYSNSPAYVEDVTIKVWATQTKTLSA